MAAKGAARATRPAYRISGVDGQALSADALADPVDKYDVVIFGEYHDNALLRTLEHLGEVAQRLDKSNAPVGTFICQGGIEPKLTEAMKNSPKGHFHKMTAERQALHDEAAKHPDAKDLAEAQKTCREILTKF